MATPIQERGLVFGTPRFIRKETFTQMLHGPYYTHGTPKTTLLNTSLLDLSSMLTHYKPLQEGNTMSLISEISKQSQVIVDRWGAGSGGDLFLFVGTYQGPRINFPAYPEFFHGPNLKCSLDIIISKQEWSDGEQLEVWRGPMTLAGLMRGTYRCRHCLQDLLQ